MSRVVILGDEARSKLANGIKKLYEAVGSTLGPGGRTVVIEDIFGGPPIITKDGVSVARNFNLSDQSENLGVDIVKQVAAKTEEHVGDGTTTATVLSYNIYTKCIEYLNSGNYTVDDIRSSLTEASKFVIENIESDTCKEISESDVYNIAMISSNGDSELSKVIVEAFNSVTKDGSITVDISESVETTVKVSPGMEFLMGFSSPNFINNTSTGECNLKNCLVFLSSVPIVYSEDILPCMKVAYREKKSLLVIAPVVTGEALSLLTTNKLQGNLECCAVNLPKFRTASEVTSDISILTGAKIIASTQGLTDTNLITDKALGSIKSVTITQSNFIIKESSVDKTEIENYITSLKTTVLPNLKKYQIPGFENRIAKLNSGVATILVGGRTEADQKERKDRADDATFAVKAALSGGTVIGGGKELYNISLKMSQDTRIGYKILSEALKSPMRLILKNAFIDESKFNLNEVSSEFGIDAHNKSLVDLRKSGILDPALVTMSAFLNALSIVNVLLSTNVVMINEGIKKTPLTDKLFD